MTTEQPTEDCTMENLMGSLKVILLNEDYFHKCLKIHAETSLTLSDVDYRKQMNDLISDWTDARVDAHLHEAKIPSEEEIQTTDPTTIPNASIPSASPMARRQCHICGEWGYYNYKRGIAKCQSCREEGRIYPQKQKTQTLADPLAHLNKNPEPEIPEAKPHPKPITSNKTPMPEPEITPPKKEIIHKEFDVTNIHKMIQDKKIGQVTKRHDIKMGE
jgi:hypothetical protein